MKAKLTSAVRALANGTATEKESIEALTGVLIKEREAICADGFILVIKQLPQREMDLDGKDQEDGIEEVIIPAENLKMCKGENVQLSCVEVMRGSLNQIDEIIKGENKTVVRLEGEGYAIEADAIQGEFPKYLKLGGLSPKIAEVALNTKLLKKLLKTLPDDVSLKLRISSPDKAIEFQCDDPDGDIPIRGMIGIKPCLWDKITWRTEDEKIEVKK